jgi:hypothetical protein
MRERGLGRYEVRGLVGDKSLIRQIANRLAADDVTAQRMREALRREVGELDQETRGGILRALRRSPLVGAELDLTREIINGRDVDI